MKDNKEPKLLEPEKCEAIDWFKMNKLPKPLSLITKLDLKAIKNLKINLFQLLS